MAGEIDVRIALQSGNDHLLYGNIVRYGGQTVVQEGQQPAGLIAIRYRHVNGKWYWTVVEWEDRRRKRRINRDLLIGF